MPTINFISSKPSLTRNHACNTVAAIPYGGQACRRPSNESLSDYRSVSFGGGLGAHRPFGLLSRESPQESHANQGPGKFEAQLLPQFEIFARGTDT